MNSVAPGPVPSDEQRKYRESPGGEEAHQAMIKRTRAADRMGEVEDVADAVRRWSHRSLMVNNRYISRILIVEFSSCPFFNNTPNSIMLTLILFYNEEYL